ncbi:MAG: endonuclease/exonuclease/phosphatase family protein [Hyphomicrobium sp.]|nr:endonuclease/exonuclease/phosphatase family protein [Hyphomicrobium sp.]
MPYYFHLRNKIRDKKERGRVIENLQKLSKQLDSDIPDKDADQNLLVATWNIRDFGKVGTRRGFGKREPETLFYIAEVLSRFDFIAIQEINELEEFEEVMNILGSHWDYIATDVTDTSLGGNGERLTYCYDKRKMWFKNISGEIVLPPSMLISKAIVDTEEGKRLYSGKQFRRTPFLTSFQSGWFKFDICTVHLYYGEESGPALRERIEEIDRIARYFGKRADAAAKAGKALILLGDFNIVHPEHETMTALLKAGFSVPKTLRNPTNFSGDKYYDQIAIVADPDVLKHLEAVSDKPKEMNAGIVDIFKSIYRPAQWSDYVDQMKKSPNGEALSSETDLKKYYRDWLTYQWSDHKPLWARFRSNDASAYLERLKSETQVE